MTTTADEVLRAGDPAAALMALQQEVRADASNPKLRIFLFQLLALTGQWPRALTQLQLCGELDHGALAMVQTYREAIQCEALRTAVFAGKATPHLLSKPKPWIALMIQALQADATGDSQAAEKLRAQAMEDALAQSGSLNGRRFEWVADADSRLGPILEVIVNGKYCWLPMSSIARLKVEAPTDLRDLLWLPASIQFPNGGETVALLPATYEGSAASQDGALQMGRRTDWLDMGHGQYRGLGQKLLATEGDEFGLYDVRTLDFDDDSGPQTLTDEV